MIYDKPSYGQNERRVVRGTPYTLKEFKKKYELEDRDAYRLFTKFGPSSIDLDAFMAARDRQELVRDFLKM
jgi:hypothetical protein